MHPSIISSQTPESILVALLLFAAPAFWVCAEVRENVKLFELDFWQNTFWRNHIFTLSIFSQLSQVKAQETLTAAALHRFIVFQVSH